jgi:cytochrome o ubiquinol oxidase subunit II
MFDVHVVSQTDFADWATKSARSGQALNADSYKELAKQSVPKDKPVYRLEDPELFLGIATQRIAPGPGPKPASGKEETANSEETHSGADHAR